MKGASTVVCSAGLLAPILLASCAAAQVVGSPVEAQSGKTFRECEACPEMVVIPPGGFSMGADTGQPHEQPVHEVTFQRPFAVSIFPITVAQFRVFAEAEPSAITSGWCSTFGADGEIGPNWDTDWKSPGFHQEHDHPVVCVSWVDAFRYLRWLSRETGRTYRLLSEAEWEYVARASLEPDALERLGQAGSGNLGAARKEGVGCCFGGVAGQDSWRFTSPVDAFDPNPLGVYDMNGNTIDLVADCVNYDYEGSPTDGSAWLTPSRIEPRWASVGWTPDGLCFGHMQRGRSWAHPPGSKVWHALRGWWYPSHAAHFFGFRVAVSLDEPIEDFGEPSADRPRESPAPAGGEANRP